MELLRYVSERIRQLRNSYGGGSGISQEALAGELKIAANTVSRWETGTYRPSLEDLAALSRFFGVSILEFFPKEGEPTESPVTALLRAARDLPKQDIEELQKYAEFRRARALLGGKAGKKKPGRPQSGQE
jgi:transcriptional regulator with XRE-family HTH domain